MNNIFDTDMDIDRTYDIKGSKIGRSISEKDKSNPTAAMKDNDFIMNEESIKMPSEIKHQFIEQIGKDLKIFEKYNINDYSLLIGIHDIKNHERLINTTSSGIFSENESDNLIFNTSPINNPVSDFQIYEGGILGENDQI